MMLAEDVRILPDAPNELVRPFLLKDRVWSCFALGDLEPAERQHTRVPVAVRPDGSVAAAWVIYEAPGDCSMVPIGELDALRRILGETVLPEACAVTLRRVQSSLVDGHLERIGPPRAITRMALSPGELRPVDAPLEYHLAPISATELNEVDALYERWEGSRLRAADFRGGPIIGARDARSDLVAVAAALSERPDDRFAIVSGVFTLENHRGRGLAKATTSALCERLFAMGCDLIALNLILDNVAAHRAYRSLGFRDAIPYERVSVQRIQAPR